MNSHNLLLSRELHETADQYTVVNKDDLRATLSNSATDAVWFHAANDLRTISRNTNKLRSCYQLNEKNTRLDRLSRVESTRR